MIKHYYKLVLLAICIFMTSKLFSLSLKDKKIITKQGYVILVGNAPLSLSAKFTTDDKKEFYLDISKTNLTISDISKFQGIHIECKGIILPYNKNSNDMYQQKDGTFILQNISVVK